MKQNNLVRTYLAETLLTEFEMGELEYWAKKLGMSPENFLRCLIKTGIETLRIEYANLTKAEEEVAAAQKKLAAVTDELTAAQEKLTALQKMFKDN